MHNLNHIQDALLFWEERVVLCSSSLCSWLLFVSMSWTKMRNQSPSLAVPVSTTHCNLPSLLHAAGAVQMQLDLFDVRQHAAFHSPFYFASP